MATVDLNAPNRLAWPSTAGPAATATGVGVLLAVLANPLDVQLIALVAAVPVLAAAMFSARFAFAALAASIGVVGAEAAVTIAVAGVSLGRVRVVDALVAAGLLGLVLQQPPTMPRPRLAHVLAVVPVGLATLVAIARGVAPDLMVTDLHLFLLPPAMYLIAARAVARGSWEFVAVVLTIVAVLASVKSLLVMAFAGFVAEGATSAWQAYAVEGSGGVRRVILIGGDTLIALGPALCALARGTRLLRNGRWVAAAVLCGVAIALTGTRTNVVVGVATVTLVLLVAQRSRGAADRVRLGVGLAAGAAALVLVLGAVDVGNRDLGEAVAARLTDRALIDNSLTYRRTEQERLLDRIAESPLVGLGAGSTFFTQLSAYTWGDALWTHNALLWLLLKSGAIGVAALLSAFALILARPGGRGTPPEQRQFVVIVLLGVLALSVTTNRLTDPGGALLLAAAFALVGARR